MNTALHCIWIQECGQMWPCWREKATLQQDKQKKLPFKIMYIFLFVLSQCNFCSPAWQFWTSWMQDRSLVFSNGGHDHRECRRAAPFRRVWGYPPPEKFQIWRLQNAIFSTCHEICLQKSTSNKCEKASVFSAYILQVFTSEVLLIWNTPYIQALLRTLNISNSSK